MQKQAQTQVEPEEPMSDTEQSNHDLEVLGLSPFHTNESKQRIAVFMILDDEGKGTITFREFYELIKYSQMFNELSSQSIHPYRLYANDIRKHTQLVRNKTNQEDLNNLNVLENGLESRYVNFKHFLGFMRTKQVFSKFINEKLDGVDIDELQMGMDQLCYPVLRNIAKIFRSPTDYMGKPLYNYELIAWETMIIEIDTITTMKHEHMHNRTYGDLTKNFKLFDANK